MEIEELAPEDLYEIEDGERLQTAPIPTLVRAMPYRPNDDDQTKTTVIPIYPPGLLEGIAVVALLVAFLSSGFAGFEVARTRTPAQAAPRAIRSAAIVGAHGASIATPETAPDKAVIVEEAPAPKPKPVKRPRYPWMRH
jgi:hypothetical protein